MAYPERIEGETAVFVRWSVQRHTAAFAELCADPEVMRHLGGAQPPAMAEEVSQRIASHWDEHGFGLWAATDAEDGSLLGFSGAARPGARWGPEVADEIEVGWRLARHAWGRGVATEGARLAIAALDVPRVISLVDPANERSMAVARRLGMRTSGLEVASPIGIRVVVMELRTAAVAA